MAVVENTTKRLLVIPPLGAIQGTTRRSRIALKPGFTKVDDNTLASVLGVADGMDQEKDGNVCVKKWFDAGMLKLCENRVETPIPHTLEGINARESIEFVKRTTDTGLMRSWLADEERATVRRAIEARIIEITGELAESD
jgi:hypothetical protein